MNPGRRESRSPKRANEPFVSVVLPVKNAAEYLGVAIRSVLRQTWRDFELIVVDDGSSDSSAEIVRSFQDVRIRLIENDTSFGVATALNYALDVARGKYIARMDADDICRPQRFEAQIAYMESHPNVVLLGTRITYMGGPWGMVDIRPIEPNACSAALLFGTPVVHPTVFIRKSALDRAGRAYDKQFSRSEDYELWTRLAEFGDIANLPGIHLKYRVHKKSITARHAATMSEQAQEITRRELKRRKVSLDDRKYELFVKIASAASMGSLAELRDARQLLEQIVDDIPPREQAAFRSATAVVWLRLCRNCGHLGIPVWRIYRELPRRCRFPGVTLAKTLFFMSCLYNSTMPTKQK